MANKEACEKLGHYDMFFYWEAYLFCFLIYLNSSYTTVIETENIYTQTALNDMHVHNVFWECGVYFLFGGHISTVFLAYTSRSYIHTSTWPAIFWIKQPYVLMSISLGVMDPFPHRYLCPEQLHFWPIIFIFYSKVYFLGTEPKWPLLSNANNGESRKLFCIR